MGLNAPPPGGPAPGNAERFHLFDGQFSVGTSYFHPLLPQTAQGLPKQIDALVERNSAAEAVNAGVFVAGRIDKNGATLVTDSLGQYPLYYFQSGERFLISNVMRYLTLAMTASGFATTPLLMPCLETIMFGGALGDATQIREIRRLPHGSYVHANPKLRFPRSAAMEYPSSYEALIAEAHKALMRHVVAIAGAVGGPRHIVADVTGGTDSRLVLSLLMASSLRDETRGRCNARYPHPDANVAAAIFARYNLRAAQMPLVYETNAHAQAKSLAKSHVDYCAGFTGATRSPNNAFVSLAFPNLVHFGGCFGEIGGSSRSYPFFDSPAEPEVTIKEAVDRFTRRTGKSRSHYLITKSGLSAARDNAVTAIRTLDDEGISREQMQSEFYLRGRCRSHFGLRNWLNNKMKIVPDPLASPWLVAARRALQWRQYSRNRVVFDLLRAGGWDDLTKMPLADKVWDTEIIPVEERDAYRSIAAIRLSTPEMSPEIGKLQNYARVYAGSFRRHTQTHQPSPGNADPMATTSPPSSATSKHYTDGYRTLLRDLIDRVPAGHDIWTLIDREAVSNLGLKESAEFSARNMATIGTLLSGIIWCLDQPEPAGVQDVKNFEP